MGCLWHTVVFRHQCSGTDEHIRDGRLAAAVAETVVVGEGQCQTAAEVRLTAHEDTLVGNEHMIQHSHGVTNTIVIIGGFQFNAGIGRNGAGNQSHTFSVGGNRKGHGPVGISSLQSAGGQHQNFVGIGSSGVVGLAAGNDNAVLTALHNAHVQIGIHLLRGTLGSVALHVGLTSIANQIVILIPRQILLEALVVVSAIVLIHLIGRDV